MITLFGGWPTRALRVGWLLEELFVEYEMRPVDLRARHQNSELQALNPAGFLPVLKDGDIVMVESIAILEYLIARYGPGGLAPATSTPAFPAYQQFLHMGEAGLAAYLNICVVSRLMAPEADRDNFGSRAAEQLFFNRVRIVDRRLEDVPYLAGDSFTAADISVAYALELAGRLGLSEKLSASTREYLQRLQSREGYKRASARQPALTSRP